jgi:hypothetical protein
MPKVAQYQPDQVSTQVVRQPRADASAGVAASQANIQATQGIADVVGAGVQLKQRIDTTSAEEALILFERDKNAMFFNPESGYFNTQGRNAFDGADAAVKALDDLKKKYSETLGSNAKVMFDQAADAHITRGQADIGRHASRGLQAWEVATTKSQIENTIENASLYWNQPDRLRVQNALGRQAVIDAAEREGVGAEATAERLQTFESSFARATITSATVHGADAGQEALESYGDLLEGSEKLKLEAGIADKRKAEKTQSDAQQAILMGNHLVETYENRESIREQVNTIDDLELRKKTMTEAMRQFNLKKKAENEAQSEAFERAESHIVEGGSAETFKAEDPEGWDRLSAKQKRSIESGKTVITDWNVYSELMTMPREQLAKVNPVEHFDKLAPAERSKLIAAVKSANGTGTSRDRIDHQVGRTRNSQTTAAVEQILGKKSKWNDKKRDQANAFYSLLDEEVAFRESQKEGSLSSEEFTQVLSDLTRKVTIERNMFGVDFLAPDVKQDVTDITPDDLRVLSKFLRNNGIPVTSENLIKAQRQATQ